MKMKRELMNALKKAVKFGDFTLASGKKSNYYIDKYIFETDPECLRILSEEIAKMIPPGTQRLAGIELGSVPLAAVTSVQSGLPYIIVRKEKKEYGTRKKIEGGFASGERVTVIEDVATTGAGAAKAVKTLRELGAIVDTVIVVVDREEGAEENLKKMGVSFVPIVKAKELL